MALSRGRRPILTATALAFLATSIALGGAEVRAANSDLGAEYWSRVAKRANDAGDCKAATTALEHALADTSLKDRGVIERLLRRYRESRSCRDESVLVQAERDLERGIYVGMMRFRGIEDPDLQSREIRLLEAIADSLFSHGRTNDVLVFLQHSQCARAPCIQFRIKLWRRLSSTKWRETTVDPPQREIFQIIALGESLRAYVSNPGDIEKTITGVRRRARSVHEDRAYAAANLPGSSLLHHRLARHYGGGSSAGESEAAAALAESTGVSWAVVPAPAADLPCSLLAILTKRVLGGGIGPVARAVLNLTQCEPGVHHWSTTEHRIVAVPVMRGRREFRPPHTYVNPVTGLVVEMPAESRYVASMHQQVTDEERLVDHEGRCFLVKGTATLTLGRESRQVMVDVKPVWKGSGPGRIEMMRAAAEELAKIFRATLPKLRHDQFRRALDLVVSENSNARQRRELPVV